MDLRPKLHISGEAAHFFVGYPGRQVDFCVSTVGVVLFEAEGSFVGVEKVEKLLWGYRKRRFYCFKSVCVLVGRNEEGVFLLFFRRFFVIAPACLLPTPTVF